MDEADKLLKISKLMEKYAMSLREGKPIKVEWKMQCDSTWNGTDYPSFTITYEWREKPREPRHIYVTYSPEGFILGINKKYKDIGKSLETVEFVEVMEGDSSDG